MTQETLSIRADDNLKKDFDKICDDFGLTSTASYFGFHENSNSGKAYPV